MDCSKCGNDFFIRNNFEHEITCIFCGKIEYYTEKFTKNNKSGYLSELLEKTKHPISELYFRDDVDTEKIIELFEEAYSKKYISDIGKEMVLKIIKNNGYTFYDLSKDYEIEYQKVNKIVTNTEKMFVSYLSENNHLLDNLYLSEFEYATNKNNFNIDFVNSLR